MVCKYLQRTNNIGEENYADKVTCSAMSFQCPKKRLILTITPHCWRFINELIVQGGNTNL